MLNQVKYSFYDSQTNISHKSNKIINDRIVINRLVKVKAQACFKYYSNGIMQFISKFPYQ